MKTVILSALALSLSVPGLATSLRNPFDYSLEELSRVLQAASPTLGKKFEPLSSAEKTRGGWVLKTEHCTLDVSAEYVARLHPLPFPQTHWLINVGECR